MSDALYASLGRKQAELEQLHTEYDRLLALLAAVLSGEIAPARVHVDLERRCWDVQPDLPATPRAYTPVVPLENG